jgi:1,4-dihydroxy-2-naphthoate octaprenyltransferase
MAAGNPMRAWLLAARPKTLLASVAPIVIGTALAAGDGVLHWPSALAALCGAMLIQIGTNYCNDYCDFVKGADTERRQGPTRAVQAGLIAPRTMLRATVLVFALAAVACAFLVARAGLPLLVIGTLSIVCGALYTAGPYPLAYLGLGDIFVLVFFGPVAVGGTYYVQALAITWPVVVAGLAPGLLSVGLLTVNNLRDVDEDRRAGTRTLAVRFGRRFAVAEYIGAVTLAFLIPPFLAAAAARGWKAALPAVVLAVALPVFRRVATETTGRGLNPALGATARLLLLYCVTFTLGWLL